MSDAELTTAIKFVYVAVPAQPVVRTSFKCKAEKAAFLGSLSSCWSLLLPGVRLACDAASAAASTAMAEAIAAETAALVENAPPEAPTVAPAPRAVTAAAVDVQSMTAAEKRALLAKLADEMAQFPRILDLTRIERNRDQKPYPPTQAHFATLACSQPQPPRVLDLPRIERACITPQKVFSRM